MPSVKALTHLETEKCHKISAAYIKLHTGAMICPYVNDCKPNKDLEIS